MRTFFCFAIGLILLFILINIAAIIVKLLQKTMPEVVEDYDEKMNTDPESLTYIYSFFSGIGEVPKGVEITEDYINISVYANCNYLNSRYDCSDFRFHLLFRLYKDYRDRIPKKSAEMIKKTILDFKYFMDEPGHDSMCYWSENHQILFATAEYLAGQEFPEEVFSSSSMTGKEGTVIPENIFVNERLYYCVLAANFLLPALGHLITWIAMRKYPLNAAKMEEVSVFIAKERGVMTEEEESLISANK